MGSGSFNLTQSPRGGDINLDRKSRANVSLPHDLPLSSIVHEKGTHITMKMKKLCNKYIRNGSQFCVNLSFGNRSRIDTSFSQNADGRFVGRDESQTKLRSRFACFFF